MPQTLCPHGFPRVHICHRALLSNPSLHGKNKGQQQLNPSKCSQMPQERDLKGQAFSMIILAVDFCPEQHRGQGCVCVSLSCCVAINMRQGSQKAGEKREEEASRIECGRYKQKEWVTRGHPSDPHTGAVKCCSKSSSPWPMWPNGY